MLFEPLDHILGTRSKVRLLRVLVPLDRPVSGREAARLAGLSHQAIAVLDDLAAAGIVERQEASGQHLYTFARSNSLAPVIERLFSEERMRAAELFRRLAWFLGSTESVLGAVIFGSAARGEAVPGSDLDLLVVVPDATSKRWAADRLVDLSPDVRRMFGAELSPVVLTLAELHRQHAEGDPFIEEVLRDERTVIGLPIRELVGGQARPA